MSTDFRGNTSNGGSRQKIRVRSSFVLRSVAKTIVPLASYYLTIYLLKSVVVLAGVFTVKFFSETILKI